MKQPADRARQIYQKYAHDLSVEDVQRLFTHDTREAYRFFARGLDPYKVASVHDRSDFRVEILEFAAEIFAAERSFSASAESGHQKQRKA